MTKSDIASRNVLLCDPFSARKVQIKAVKTMKTLPVLLTGEQSPPTSFTHSRFAVSPEIQEPGAPSESRQPPLLPPPAPLPVSKLSPSAG